MDNEIRIGKYSVRACPEALADGLGWSERFFIKESEGSYTDEHAYTGTDVHRTKEAAIKACISLARRQIQRF